MTSARNAMGAGPYALASLSMRSKSNQVYIRSTANRSTNVIYVRQIGPQRSDIHTRGVQKVCGQTIKEQRYKGY